MLYYLVGVLLLLGILIFIHEFGHFYVAKLCGMKVKTFSIGMGHKILKFTRGETEYALSWIPFGGYVNIMGQDPREEIPAGEKHRSFSNMPLWKRFAVVIAGPAANFILTFLVFWLLFTKGFPSPSATVHFVHPGSVAAAAGFEAGDKILAVESNAFGKQDVRELADLQRYMRAIEDGNLKIEIEHQGAQKEIGVEGVRGKMSDPVTGLERDAMTIPGIEFSSYPPLFVPEKNSELEKKSKTFFIVESVAVDGEKTDVDSVFQVDNAWKSAKNQNKKLSLIVRHVDMNDANAPVSEPETIEIGTPDKDTLKEFGFTPAHLLVTQTLEGSAAAKLGLQKGDIIVELNNLPVWTFNQFRNRLQEVSASGSALQLKWLRNGVVQEGEFTPQHVDTENAVTQVKEKKFQLGAMFVGYSEASFEKVKAHGFFDGMRLAWQKTAAMSVSIVESFVFLATGKVSVKAMGGPVMIGKIAGDSLRLGWDYFLKMLAFISLNLCILNLMPLPVLDGGHILLFVVEGLARRPIPVKFIEAWAATGFFLLMGLALFVTFNDLNKLNFLAPVLKVFGK